MQVVTPMIHVPDVRKTIDWYVSIGFVVTGTDEECGDLNWARLSLDGSDVMFASGGQASSSERREVDLYIDAKDIARVFERVKTKAEVVEGLHDTFYGMREFIVRDVNGFWVTFGEPIDGVATDEACVRQLIEQWAEAVRARNIEGILAHHTDDFVMFDVPPPFESTGLEAYRKTWDLFYAWSDDPPVFAFDDLRVTAGDTVAFAVASMHCTVKNEKGGFEPLKFRVTIGLRKVAGQWLVTHEHHSIPAVG